MFETIGVPELLIIGVVVLLLFGVGKVGRLGKDLGEGIKEFRRAMNEEDTKPDNVSVVTDAPANYITGVSTPVAPPAPYAPQPLAYQPQYVPAPAPQAQVPGQPGSMIF